MKSKNYNFDPTLLCLIDRNYEPLPPAKRDETLPCALFLFIGKCMEMIVYSIAEEIKVAEHSFRARFRSRNSARAQGFQKTNMPSIERSLYLLKTRTHCVIFLYN